MRPDAADTSRIAEQHRELRETLEEVGNASSLERLQPLLKRLRDELRMHFQDEEGPRGLEDTIGEAAPRMLRTLDRLFAEHRAFLKALDHLIGRCDQLLNGPKQEILREVGDLQARLR